MKIKIKRKIKWKNIIILVFLLISIGCIIVSGVNLIKWHHDNKKIEQEIKEIENITTIEEVIETEDNKSTIEVIDPKEEIPKENPYWDYVKMSLINVDFNELKNKNSDTVGWIQVSGTNINYPFVQTTDNKYYLNHSFNKSYTDAGWVFLDYRNDLSTMDKNTIIYAHGRLDKTMFGSLKNILSSGWLNNSNNYIVKLSTEYENTLWQVFSVYHIPTTNDYIRVNFKNDGNFLDFANMLMNRSKYNFNTTINESDHILTLSTCYNKTEKVVLHAKLIKKETR